MYTLYFSAIFFFNKAKNVDISIDLAPVPTFIVGEAF